MEIAIFPGVTIERDSALSGLVREFPGSITAGNEAKAAGYSE